jgi:hypothetical protein
MKDYALIKIDSADIKYFTISLGLLPGYDSNNIEYPFEKTLSIYEKWVQQRIKDNHYIFAAKVIPSNFVYGFKNSQGKIITNSEKAVDIQGEILRKYCIDFDNNDTLMIEIKNLALVLGNSLEQERIHVHFNNQKYILEVKK